MSLVMEHNSAIKHTVDKVKTVAAVVAFGTAVVLGVYALSHSVFAAYQDNSSLIQLNNDYTTIKPDKAIPKKLPDVVKEGDGGADGGGTTKPPKPIRGPKPAGN